MDRVGGLFVGSSFRGIHDDATGHPSRHVPGVDGEQGESPAALDVDGMFLRVDDVRGGDLGSLRPKPDLPGHRDVDFGQAPSCRVGFRYRCFGRIAYVSHVPKVLSEEYWYLACGLHSSHPKSNVEFSLVDRRAVSSRLTMFRFVRAERKAL
jgi:hypothetical protein